MHRIRVAAADDDGLVRDGLGAIVSAQADMEFVGAAEDGEGALSLCRRERPDALLLDVRMPKLDGVAATARIKAELPETKVIILTTFDDGDYIRGAIDAGAEGYLLKSSPAEAILESIRAVRRGTTVLQTEVARRLRSMLAAGPISSVAPATTGGLGLSPRESEILTLIAEGLSNKEIAGRLGLSDGTVRNYVSDLLVKLDARDRTQLAILYYRSLA